MWKEVGKNILKGTIVTVGTKVMSEKFIPAAADFSKEVWDRVKKTKSTGKDDQSEEKSIETVDGKKARVVYDAEFTDKN